MQISNAIRLVREACGLRHLSLNNAKTYTYWIGRYGCFLKDPELKHLPIERRMEEFLTRLTLSGMSASTQSQAFNALLFFYRDVLKQDLGPVQALRGKRPPTIRHAPTREEVSRLLASVSDLFGYPTHLIVHLLYACGLRVTEPLASESAFRRLRYVAAFAGGCISPMSRTLSASGFARSWPIIRPQGAAPATPLS